jgi:hypothetical protein
MRPLPSAILALTDAQLSIVMAASRPLRPADRDGFFEGVADRLKDTIEIGDGTVARICREVQRAHYDPPILVGSRSRGRA